MVIVHGGHEDYQLPSPRMQQTYRFFIDAGADAVINHHQHCYSGYEFYNNKPIFYGLGNFCFDKFAKRLSQTTWQEGYMVVLEITKGGIDYELIPYNQCGKNPIVEIINIENIYERLSELNSIIANPDLLQDSFDNMCKKRGENLLISTLSPLMNKYLLGMARKHFLPSFITKSRLLRAADYILCESHRDVLDNEIQTKINNKQ